MAGSDSTSSRWRIEKRYKTTGALDVGFGESGAVINDPSSFNDQAFDITGDDTYIYIVGFDTTGPPVGVASPLPQWRIEKRYKSSGSF